MIRIITGAYKRKELSVIGKTRPPLKRIRTWVFDVLSNYVDFRGITVLDLFAGSGSFGLEAASRGAGVVFFVEKDYDTAQQLHEVIKTWGMENAKILRMNAAYLPECYHKPDLIFVDPPFGHGIIKIVIEKLIKKSWLKENTLIVLRSETLFEDPRFNVLSKIEIGISNIYILRIGVK